MNVGILIPGFSANEQDWCIPVYLNLVSVLAQTDDVRVFALRYRPRWDEYAVYGARQYAADLIAGAELPPRRLEIVPLGIDTALFSPSPAQDNADRLVAVGSLTRVKGHDRLLQALARLPGIRLDIAGEGPFLTELQAL